MRKRRYPKEKFARLGNEIHENKMRPLVGEGNKGKIVAIDIESRDYEIGRDRDAFDCAYRLSDKNPDAQIWFVRIGHDAVYRLPRFRPVSE